MRRLCALVLFVLSASPLTAPFSVADAQDLFAPHTATVHAKKAPDEPLVALCHASGVSAIVHTPVLVVASLPGEYQRTRAAHVVPLRI